MSSSTFVPSKVESVVINWSSSDFDAFVKGLEFPPEWEAELPAPGQTAADVPSGKITIYADFFLKCHFRLPATRFFVNLLKFYQVHVSQLHCMGMCRLTHFEFCCRSLGIDPTPSRFNVFYRMRLVDSWFSFNQCSAKAGIGKAPSSFHSWEKRFFYIKRDVLPLVMDFRSATDTVVDPPLIPFKNEAWFNALVARPTTIAPIPEGALVAVGMSRLWNKPDRVPVYKVIGVGKYFI